MPSDASAPFVLTIVQPEAAAPAPFDRLHDRTGARIELDLRSASRRNLWAVQLDDAVHRAGAPAVIVAHGIGCLAVAWWARLSPAFYLSSVAGALLVAPGCGDDPEQAPGLLASPRTLLPFPTIVVGAPDRIGDGAHLLARAWGSQFVRGTSLGAFGRRDGTAAWLRGERLLRSLFLDLVAEAPVRDAREASYSVERSLLSSG